MESLIPILHKIVTPINDWFIIFVKMELPRYIVALGTFGKDNPVMVAVRKVIALDSDTYNMVSLNGVPGDIPEIVIRQSPHNPAL
jgi:hypothetical protein